MRFAIRSALVLSAALCVTCSKNEGAAPQPVPAAGQASDASAALLAANGQELYEKYCAFCHGSVGEGYRADRATALSNEEFLAIASDEYLRLSIARGRPGTVMSAWGRAKGGPLTEGEIDLVVRYIRTWQKRPFVPAAPPPTRGEAARGASIYERDCQRCHGANGTGGPYVQLANPEFLALASDAYLRTSIERGRPGTPMSDFGFRLSAEQLDDLVAFLRSLHEPTEAPSRLAPQLPPDAGKLQNVVIHPNGPPPGFDPNAQFISVDAVKAALDRGASLVLSDARPAGDYAAGHITGAISVPFYSVEAYASQIPKDKFIITYCGCPHAESGRAAETFRKLGFKNVAVLDEGINVWRSRGYPITTGPNP